ncbi:MAG: ABC transporter transmembrane domain-containing protein, partial [Pseudonocardiaceae bacterium]
MDAEGHHGRAERCSSHGPSGRYHASAVFTLYAPAVCDSEQVVVVPGPLPGTGAQTVVVVRHPRRPWSSDVKVLIRHVRCGMGMNSTSRRVAALFWPYRRQLVMLGLVVVVTAGLGVGSLLLIKPVFDDALFCSRGCPNLPLLFWLVSGMIAIPVATAALGIGQPYLANLLGQRIMQDLRDALYSHLQRMPLRFFTETKTGEIQSRLA